MLYIYCLHQSDRKTQPTLPESLAASLVTARNWSKPYHYKNKEVPFVKSAASVTISTDSKLTNCEIPTILYANFSVFQQAEIMKLQKEGSSIKHEAK